MFQPGIVAEDTFKNTRFKCARILEGWNIKRTGNHASSATDTDIRVVDNSSLWGLGIGIDETGGETGGFLTMIALHFSK